MTAGKLHPRLKNRRRLQLLAWMTSVLVHLTAAASVLLIGSWTSWQFLPQVTSPEHTFEDHVIYLDSDFPSGVREQDSPIATRIRTEAIPVSHGFVEQQLEQARQHAEALDSNEQLAQLEQLTGRLESISSEASIEAISVAVQRLLGTSERASEPASQPVDGDFDLDTAQLHDVLRLEDPPEGIRYVAVLLDRHGRTEQVELERTQGESVYQAMEQIRSHPLLEQIYRKIAMPLFDQLLSEIREPAATD